MDLALAPDDRDPPAELRARLRARLPRARKRDPHGQDAAQEGELPALRGLGLPRG